MRQAVSRTQMWVRLRLKLDAWSSAVYGWQRGQKCSSPTRRLPSRNWGPIRPRVCSWFRAPIRHECQTAQPKGRERTTSTTHTHTHTHTHTYNVYTHILTGIYIYIRILTHTNTNTHTHTSIYACINYLPSSDQIYLSYSDQVYLS